MAAVWAADIDSAALLSRAQSKIRDNARRIPRYVCRQKIERTAFARPAPHLTISVNKSGNCWTLSDRGRPKVPSLSLMQADRAQLDVMLAEGGEFFSWPGGRSFDTSDPGDLLGGGLSGSGDFAGFVISVLGSDEATCCDLDRGTTRRQRKRRDSEIQQDRSRPGEAAYLRRLSGIQQLSPALAPDSIVTLTIDPSRAILRTVVPSVNWRAFPRWIRAARASISAFLYAIPTGAMSV